jgi:membrane protein DedA with SNARE-associated domain
MVVWAGFLWLHTAFTGWAWPEDLRDTALVMVPLLLVVVVVTRALRRRRKI